MESLEEKSEGIVVRETDRENLTYGEKKLLNSYMNVNLAEVYDCETCNNCGSGDCASCCSSPDD